MTKLRRIFPLLTAISLFLLAVACGGDAEGSASGQPGVSGTVEVAPTTSTDYEAPTATIAKPTATSEASSAATNDATLAVVTSSPTPLPTLDAPYIDSSGGVFGTPQTVTIRSGETDARVLYTLDGTSPSPQTGTIYTKPIVLTEPAKLRAVTYRAGQDVSEIAAADFVIFDQVLEKTGDINLSGNDQMIIEDTLFLHEGNITLTDNAQLIIRNSFVTHVKDFAFQYGVSASGHSRVTIENSSVGSNCTGSFNYSFLENATLYAEQVDIGVGNCNTWVFMSGNSDVDITTWDYFGGTVCDGSAVSIENSQELEVELCLPGGSTVDTALPTSVDLFKYGPQPINGIEFSLIMNNVTVDGWGINVLPGSNITIRDSDAITIGIIAGRPWEEAIVEIDGLESGYYDLNKWWIGPDASLTLINTSVYGWEPNVFADNTLIIRDSNYTASTVNSGDAHYEIVRSTVNVLSASERVTMTITDSVITGDVIANDDAVIILINCDVRGSDYGDGLVGGNVFARGNGKVILRNTTVAGETVAQDGGEITTE